MTEFNPTTGRLRKTLVLLLAGGALALSACGDKTGDSTAGQKVDSAIAKTEQAGADAKAKADQMVSEAKAKSESTAANASASMDDAAITAGVSTGLAKDPDLSAIKIDVDTKGGVVSLNGPAPTAAAKARATAAEWNGAPAFILTVDAATRNFTVRKVGAQPEAGKSYELWIVSDKLQRPRSLGVIGNNDFTARPILAAYDSEIVNQATFAVSVEPPGGSPSGAPTGPVVFSGKLIETVPPAASGR